MERLENNKAISEMATLLASHKLVPFLGAGCSLGHVGYDWNGLTQEMATKLDSSQTNNLEIAEGYEAVYGKEGISKLLTQRLIVDEYRADKDAAPLIVLSLGIGLVYTTNQDNVFELCAEAYGRNFRKIVTLKDFAASRPGEGLYIKYHGDLARPETIIFTKSSYSERLDDVDHFLNIRMRADLLAKGFLFIGYSFRDPNIMKLFEEIRAAFGGKVPPSYLIAFDYSSELEKLDTDYGVKVINPAQETGCFDNKEAAFELFISALCRKVWQLKAAQEVEDMFRPTVPSSTSVVTIYEIRGIKERVEESPASEGMSVFRGVFDGAIVPEEFHDEVAKIFLLLASKCRDRELSDQLQGAAFNLYLGLEQGLMVLAAVLATAQFRDTSKDGLDLFRPIVKDVPEGLYPLATAIAIELLGKWQVSIDDSFRTHVTSWVEDYSDFPSQVIRYIEQQVNYAWSGHTTREHPFKYWSRVGRQPRFLAGKKYQEIADDLVSKLPKHFAKPYEE